MRRSIAVTATAVIGVVAALVAVSSLAPVADDGSGLQSNVDTSPLLTQAHTPTAERIHNYASSSIASLGEVAGRSYAAIRAYAEPKVSQLRSHIDSLRTSVGSTAKSYRRAFGSTYEQARAYVSSTVELFRKEYGPSVASWRDAARARAQLLRKYAAETVSTFNLSTPSEDATDAVGADTHSINDAKGGSWRNGGEGSERWIGLQQDNNTSNPPNNTATSTNVTEPAPIATVAPSPVATDIPTEAPSAMPTNASSPVPTNAPSPVPTEAPSAMPTEEPTHVPTAVPTPISTVMPTPVPTPVETLVPTEVPSPSATLSPTPVETRVPTDVPTESPTPGPTVSPTPTQTAEPTGAPSPMPTATPTESPTSEPTVSPTPTPTAEPTGVPSPSPTAEPTGAPTPEPTASPTAPPTDVPTASPTAPPTAEPTAMPTPTATTEPTAMPTPTATRVPTAEPTSMPTAAPTPMPTDSPTAAPTSVPTPSPTGPPTPLPTTSTQDEIIIRTRPVAPTPAPTDEPMSAGAIFGIIIAGFCVLGVLIQLYLRWVIRMREAEDVAAKKRREEQRDRIRAQLEAGRGGIGNVDRAPPGGAFVNDIANLDDLDGFDEGIAEPISNMKALGEPPDYDQQFSDEYDGFNPVKPQAHSQPSRPHAPVAALQHQFSQPSRLSHQQQQQPPQYSPQQQLLPPASATASAGPQGSLRLTSAEQLTTSKRGLKARHVMSKDMFEKVMRAAKTSNRALNTGEGAPPMQLEMSPFATEKPSVVKRAKKPRAAAGANGAEGEERKEAGEGATSSPADHLANLRLQPGSKMAAAISRNSPASPTSAQGGDSPSVSGKEDKI